MRTLGVKNEHCRNGAGFRANIRLDATPRTGIELLGNSLTYPNLFNSAELCDVTLDATARTGFKYVRARPNTFNFMTQRNQPLDATVRTGINLMPYFSLDEKKPRRSGA